MSKKEEIKINFHDKEMSLNKTKLYIYGLKLGIIKPKLTNEEYNNYLSWKYPEEGREEMIKMLVEGKEIKEKTQEGYLVKILKQAINTEKGNYCKKHGGHVEKEDSAYTMP